MLWVLGRGRRHFLMPWSSHTVWLRGPRGIGLLLRARTPESVFTGPLPERDGNTIREVTVRRIRDRVAGLDVHRDSVAVCAQLLDGNEVRLDKTRFATTTAGVGQLA